MRTCSQCDTPLPDQSRFCPACGAVVPTSDPEEMLATSGSDPTGLLDRVRAATAGEFRIIRELGRGGMGRVFLVHEIALDRRVAMKVLPPAFADHREVVERFKREARTAGKLSHPHIVSVFKVSDRDGLTFFTMPYIAGPSLRQVLRQTPQLSIDLACRYVREAADALGYAHGQGVIHRDIKPENVLLEGSRNGRLLLTDFGIAKALGAGTTLTRPGDVMGTPYYMSPEQCKMRDRIDGRSDQYSLGLVTYEMLAGRFPFNADSMAGIVYKHLHEDPEPIERLRPEVPQYLAALIARATAKEPADRFPTMQELGAALDEGRAVPRGSRPARVTVPPARAPRGGSRTRRVGWREPTVAAVLALAAFVGGVVVWGERGEGAEDRTVQLAELTVTGSGPVGEELAPDSVTADRESSDAGSAVAGSGAAIPDASSQPGDTGPDESEAARRAETTRRDDGEAEAQRARIREALQNARAEGLRARRSAVDARADSIFPGEFALLDSQLGEARALWSSGHPLRALELLAVTRTGLRDLAGRARQAREAADRAAAAGDATGRETDEAVSRTDEPKPAETKPGPEARPRPEDEIGELLEVYRRALEDEDTARIRREVYRSAVPDRGLDVFVIWFKNADRLNVELQPEGLQVDGDRANARIEHRMSFRLTRTGERRTHSFVLNMTFERDSEGWRLTGVRR